MPTQYQLLCNAPYFRGIPEAVAEALVANMVAYTYQAGENLFFEGEPNDGLYIVEHGYVKLYRTSEKGRSVVVRIVRPGGCFAEVPVFDGGVNPVSAMALSDCKVWLVPAAALRHEIDRSLELAHAIILAMSQNARELVDKIAGLSFQDVTARLAGLILELPPETLKGPQRLTQEDLAACLGTVREVVGRSLRYLDEQGAIRVRRGHITVMDKEALRRLSHAAER